MVLSETIPPPAADQASDRVASIFTSTPADPRVWIAHGYGIRVGVWNGQLETSDGIGKHRRTRNVPKADRQLRRLVVAGQKGYVTLSALHTITGLGHKYRPDSASHGARWQAGGRNGSG